MVTTGGNVVVAVDSVDELSVAVLSVARSREANGLNVYTGAAVLTAGRRPKLFR